MSAQAERRPRRTAPPSAPVAPAARRGDRVPVPARLAAWRDQHLYGLFSSLGRLSRRPVANALTVLVIGFALSLPLLFFLVYDNARTLAGGLEAAREVTVFLKPGAAASDADALAQTLRGRADVASVLVRTPEQGLAEFRAMSGFGEALEVLDGSPLPHVLVVAPRHAEALDEASALAAVIEADPMVDLVQYDAQWRRKLGGILDFGERAVLVMAVLLGLAALLAIGNTVRMDIQSRAGEISVMQLLGASNGFVRRPFLYAGLWYGLLGGLCALAIVLAVQLALGGPLGRLLDSYGNRYDVHGLQPVVVLLVIGGSMLLGWIGAWVATARHLAAGRPA